MCSAGIQRGYLYLTSGEDITCVAHRGPPPTDAVLDWVRARIADLRDKQLDDDATQVANDNENSHDPDLLVLEGGDYRCHPLTLTDSDRLGVLILPAAVAAPLRDILRTIAQRLSTEDSQVLQSAQS